MPTLPGCAAPGVSRGCNPGPLPLLPRLLLSPLLPVSLLPLLLLPLLPAAADSLAAMRSCAAGVPVSVRHTRGLEVAAACGQLRNMHQKEPLAEFAMAS